MYSTVSGISGKQSEVAFSKHHRGICWLLPVHTNRENGTQTWKTPVKTEHVKNTDHNVTLRDYL